MITLILGTPDSGKSMLAEKMAMERAKGDLIYLATMIAYDEEGRERIAKHRNMREGKGFITIEKPFNITEILDELTEDSTVLLECITNLVGNEMHENGTRYVHNGDSGVMGIDIEDLCEKLVDDIKAIGEKVACLILVSNRFMDLTGDTYQGETKKFTDAVNALNMKLGDIADDIAVIAPKGAN